MSVVAVAVAVRGDPYLNSLPIPLVFSIIISHPHHRYWAIDLTYEETDSIMVIYDA